MCRLWQLPMSALRTWMATVSPTSANRTEAGTRRSQGGSFTSAATSGSVTGIVYAASWYRRQRAVSRNRLDLQEILAVRHGAPLRQRTPRLWMLRSFAIHVNGCGPDLAPKFTRSAGRRGAYPRSRGPRNEASGAPLAIAAALPIARLSAAHGDLTQLAGAPPAAGDPSVLMSARA